MQSPQGDLFAAIAKNQSQQTEEISEHPVLSALQEIQPDELSPKAALEKLYQLKKMI